MKGIDHPNEPGKWSRLAAAEGKALWRRDRLDPVPVTLFYVVAPPRQSQVFYEIGAASAAFDASPDSASAVPASPPP